MARKKTTQGRAYGRSQQFDMARDPSEVTGSGEGRRFLKHLDRRLQRFSHRIDALEDRATRLSSEDDTDLILAIESLHRETLLLRAEIREHLAGGGRSLADMTEYAEESWEQLRDTYEELMENLDPDATKSSESTFKTDRMDENEDGEWSEVEDGWVASEVHPPRVGPKR